MPEDELRSCELYDMIFFLKQTKKMLAQWVLACTLKILSICMEQLHCMGSRTLQWTLERGSTRVPQGIQNGGVTAQHSDSSQQIGGVREFQRVSTTTSVFYMYWKALVLQRIFLSRSRSLHILSYIFCLISSILQSINLK